MTRSTSASVACRRQRLPAGVVFDCDGVLVDSEPLHARATTSWAAGLGITLTPDFFHDLVGMTVPQQIALIVRDTGHDPNESYQVREEHFWAIAGEIAPMLGAVALAMRLKKAGTRIAIASNGSRRYLQHVVDRLGLNTVIDGFVCAEDVTHPKPHPEPYVKAATLLGLSPRSCVAIEDSATGAASALAAGLRVIKFDVDSVTTSGYSEGMETAVDFDGVAAALYGSSRRITERLATSPRSETPN